MKIKVKRIHEDAVIPHYAHDTDSGFDLYTCEDLQLEAFSKGIAKTGLIFEMPYGWGIQCRNKSGMTVNNVPCRVITFESGSIEEVESREDATIYIGTIDQNYRGEIGIMVKNENPYSIIIPKHTKLAQGVLEKVYQCEFEEVGEVSETDRGEGGFGSTGDSLK